MLETVGRNGEEAAFLLVLGLVPPNGSTPLLAVLVVSTHPWADGTGAFAGAAVRLGLAGTATTVLTPGGARIGLGVFGLGVLGVFVAGVGGLLRLRSRSLLDDGCPLLVPGRVRGGRSRCLARQVGGCR